MTAILAGYTREGFFIGADGRKWDSETRTALSDDEQKIFGIRAKGRDVAYALTGSVASDRGIFDLVEDCKKESVRLADRHFESLRAYIEPFIRVIKRALIKAKEHGETYPVNLDRPIVSIFFVGFFKKRGASQAIVIFRHDNQILQEPQVCCGPAKPGWHCGSGSQKIAQNVFGEQPPFAADATLEEGIQSAIRYIEAHKHPDAVQTDDFCEIVGGRIHIATVTAEVGFQWHTPPTTGEGDVSPWHTVNLSSFQRQHLT